MSSDPPPPSSPAVPLPGAAPKQPDPAGAAADAAQALLPPADESAAAAAPAAAAPLPSDGAAAVQAAPTRLPSIAAFSVSDAEKSFSASLGKTGFHPKRTKSGDGGVDAGAAPPAAGGLSAFAAKKPRGKSLLNMAVRKVAVMTKVVDNMDTNAIFDALAKEKATKNPAKLMYRFFRDLELDPYSQPHVIWDLFILLLVFYSSILEPYKAAFVTSTGVKPMDIMVDLCFYADIIANFFTGVDRGYEIVYDKKVIAKTYLRGWFWVDIMATVQWDLIVNAVAPSADSSTVRLVKLIKVARLARASRLVRRLTNTWTINTGFVQSGKFIVYVLIVAHLLACGFFMVPVLITCPETPSEKMSKAFVEGDYVGLKPDSADCRRDSWRAGLFDSWVPAKCTNKAAAAAGSADTELFYAKSATECADMVARAYTWMSGDGECWDRGTTSAVWRQARPPLLCTGNQQVSNATCEGSLSSNTQWRPPQCLDSCGTQVVPVPANQSVCTQNASHTWIGAGCFRGSARVSSAQSASECRQQIFINGTCLYNGAGSVPQARVVYAENRAECVESVFVEPEWNDATPRSYAYVIALYWSLTTMTTIGYGDYGPSTQEEIVFVLFAEVIGLSFFAVLLDQINNLNEVLSKQEIAVNELKNTVIGFMKSSQVPLPIIHDTIAFLNFKATSNSGATIDDDDPVFAMLSHPLRRRIKISMFKPALLNIKFLGYAKDTVAEEDRVRHMFLEVDEDGGGTLDESEIRLLITEKLNMKMSPELMHEAFKEMNSGSSEGDVDLGEFEQWWFRKKFGVPKISKPPHDHLDELAYLLNSRTKAVAPGDAIVQQGDYGQRTYFLLAGTFKLEAPNSTGEKQPLVIERSTLNLTDCVTVSHVDREPVCGLSAALRPGDRARTQNCTQEWKVTAVTYCDLAYLECDYWGKLFETTWPAGHDEYLRISECFYHFSEPRQSFGSQLASEMTVSQDGQGEVLDLVATADFVTVEAELQAKIDGVRANLTASIRGIEAKLDRLLQGNAQAPQ